jgi:hypothetical protein
MLFIYTHQISNRVKYTFNLIFKSILEIDFNIISDQDEFKQFEGAKLSYTLKPIGNEIFFQSSLFLFETGIKSATTFQITKEGELETGEDIFALIFFLVSRYEEYLPFSADKYGRFSAQQSFAFKNNFLHKPVVNREVKKIQNIISSRYPAITFPQKKYVYTPTFDIDNAYAYLGKSLTRTIGGYLKAFAKYNINDFLKRSKVLLKKEKDPYDTYDHQYELHSKYDLKPIYFFLLGNWAPNDKNLSHTNLFMQQLINTISSKAETGIHPSFASNTNQEKVKTEKERLEKIRNTGITKSRQHFLMLRFPDTYRNLIASGITDDYTMGFADEVGFRAGICTPFIFYDLEKEEESKLSIHPFAVMDGTLNNYLKLSPQQAIEKVKKIIKEIKNVNGEFMSLWHNEALSDWREWRGWRMVYEEMIKEATSPQSSPQEREIF